MAGRKNKPGAGRPPGSVDFTHPRTEATMRELARLRSEGKSVDDWYIEQGWQPPGKGKEGKNAVQSAVSGERSESAAAAGKENGSAGESGAGETANGRPVDGGENAEGGQEGRLYVGESSARLAPPASHQSYQSGRQEVSAVPDSYRCGSCRFTITKEDRFCPSCGERLVWKGIS